MPTECQGRINDQPVLQIATIFRIASDRAIANSSHQGNTKMSNERSFNQMIKDGDIKRADAMKVRKEDFHEEPGFNWRIEGEDLDKSIEEIADFLIAGGQLPDLEVRPREDGGVWIVDGHRRNRGYDRAIVRGATLDHLRDKNGQIWIGVKPFLGSRLERMARIESSSRNRQLSPLELSNGYQEWRLAFQEEHGTLPTNDEIAKAFGKSRAHIDQMLLLNAAPSEVKAAVAAGEISATESVKLVREHGQNAAAELDERKKVASEIGKVKVTAASQKKPSAPARPKVDMVVSNAVVLVKSLNESVLMACEQPDDSLVSISSHALADLIQAVRDMQAPVKALDADKQIDMLDEEE